MTREGLRFLDELRVEDPQLELPWEGRSPRVLTQAYQKFTLSRETAPPMVEFEFDDQILDEQDRRFHHGT